MALIIFELASFPSCGSCAFDDVKASINANEIAILPYYIANLNIEVTYMQKMGAYVEFPNLCLVDTLDNNLDLSTFEFQKFGFLRWEIPIASRYYFNSMAGILILW